MRTRQSENPRRISEITYFVRKWKMPESDPPITSWIDAARTGDSDAEAGLWNYYFGQVARLARVRMLALQRTVYDEEDATSSALRSLFRGLREHRFPELNDRDNLWRLLVLITKRKARAQWRREKAGHRVPAEAVNAEIPIEQIICSEPTPDFVSEMMDETERLLAALGDDRLRKIAVMRMDGLTNDDIADRLGCASRTIRRKIDLIRKTWGESTSNDS